MYVLGGKFLKSARANPRSKTLADAYASMESRRVNTPRYWSWWEPGLTIARRNWTMTKMMRVIGNRMMGMMVTAREAKRQSFCSV